MTESSDKAETTQPCKANVDGWCETHSTSAGPSWCIDALKDALRRARFHEAHNYDRWKAAERVGLLGDAETCYRCGGENVIWNAPSPLWNRVMRGNDINGDSQYHDLVCIRCFIVLAFEQGIEGTWRLHITPEPEGLIYDTPSGRIWDPEDWLWVEPDVTTPSGKETP